MRTGRKGRARILASVSPLVSALAKVGALPPRAHSFRAPVLWRPQDAGLKTETPKSLCVRGTEDEKRKSSLLSRQTLG